MVQFPCDNSCWRHFSWVMYVFGLLSPPTGAGENLENTMAAFRQCVLSPLTLHWLHAFLRTPFSDLLSCLPFLSNWTHAFPFFPRPVPPPPRCSAVQLGTDMLELDCHLTKDEQVVVLHDTNLKRSTGLNADISDVAYVVSGAPRPVLCLRPSHCEHCSQFLHCRIIYCIIAMRACVRLYVVCVCEIFFRTFRLTCVGLAWLSSEVSGLAFSSCFNPPVVSAE